MNILCNDGIIITLPQNQIEFNTTLASMLEDVSPQDAGEIPIPFSSKSVQQLIILTTIQQKPELQNIDSINDPFWRDNLHPQEQGFITTLENEQCPLERKWDAIGNLAILADFLDNQRAFHACIKYIANVLETQAQNVDTLRKILQVENDLTTIEETTIRDYNKWCEQDQSD